MLFATRRSSGTRDSADGAARTAAVVAAHPDWVWPYSPAQKAAENSTPASSPATASTTAVSSPASPNARPCWTRLVTVGRATDAVVDTRGLVTPELPGWSLDWWVGADDRWYFPSREVAVRQELFEGTPIVLTRLRVPGGDIEHRVMALQGPPMIEQAPLGVLDIFNGAKTPVVLALAIRPADPTGVASVDSIELADDIVLVNDEPALFLPVAPRAAALGDHTMDLAEVVMSESTERQQRARVDCPEGLAQAALLFPLTHQTRIRFGVSLHALGSDRFAVPSNDGPVSDNDAIAAQSPPSGSSLLALLPPVDPVAAGWKNHREVGARFKLPDARLTTAFEAVRQFLLGHAAASGAPTIEAGVLLRALAELGRTDEAERWYQGWLDDMGLASSFGGFRSRPDSDEVAVTALGDGWSFSHDHEVFEPHIGGVAKAAHLIEKREKKAARSREKPGPSASIGISTAPAVSAPPAAVAFAAGQRLLRGLGQTDAADLIAERFARVEANGRTSPSSSIAATPTTTSPPSRTSHAPASAESYLVRASGGATDFAATIALAHQELLAGDARSMWARVSATLDAAGSTWVWPGPGAGHDVGVGARFVSLVRAMWVHEVGESRGECNGVGEVGLALASGMVPEFYGQNIEVHEAPTHAGRLSYALRWHGERPALLWELEPWPESQTQSESEYDFSGFGSVFQGVRLTSPTLDPDWSSTDLSGEVLLATPPSPPPGSRPIVPEVLESVESVAEQAGASEVSSMVTPPGPSGETSVSLRPKTPRAGSDPAVSTESAVADSPEHAPSELKRKAGPAEPTPSEPPSANSPSVDPSSADPPSFQ